MLFEKTFEQILAQSISDLSSNTNLNAISPGSKARSILEIASRKLNETYRSFDINLARAFVSGASGLYLDYIGDLFGISRLGTAAANASTDLKSVRFYVTSGTFGNINNAANISIPGGTLISSTSNGTGISYRLISTTVLPLGSSSVYVAVEAINPGTPSNIGPGLLTSHNFTNYTDLVNGTLKVINDQGIFSGRDIENDTNYRFRITKAVTTAESANQIAIQLAALSIPGVSEVVFFKYARGIGTFDIIIKATTPNVSDSLLAAVQSAIEDVTAAGVVGLARKPVETGISFSISMRYKSGVLDSDRIAIESKVRAALINYVNSLDIGEEFIINEAVTKVLSTDERIKDIGIPSRPFDDISIYVPSKLQDNKVRSTLIKNYSAAEFERVIIEPSVPTPITITTVV